MAKLGWIWKETAELVGVTAIVLSLVFVGIQIRDGNREARASTMQSALDTEMAFMAVVAEHTGIWDKVVRGEPLESDEERRTAIILYNMALTEGENRYHQFEAGYLEPRMWKGRVASLQPLVRLPIYETWRKTIGSLNHSPDYLSLLEDLREEGNQN